MTKHAIAATRHRLRKRIWTLRFVSAIAPLLGVFATCNGIVNAFRGNGCSCRESGLHMFSVGMSEAVATTAMGLVLGILAHWAYDYCESKVQDFELEMKCASLELLNYLGAMPSVQRSTRI